MPSFKIRVTPISPGNQAWPCSFFNRPARGLLPRFSRQPTLCDNNDSNHTLLGCRQPNQTKIQIFA